MNKGDAYKRGYKEGYTDAMRIFKEATTDFMTKIAGQLPKDVEKLLEGKR